jgi:thioester reductase-like protein
MSIFVTGSTGYLGSYVVAGLMREHRERLSLLVRAQHPLQARERLWRALQLHMDFDEFRSHMDSRVDIYMGDITERDLGLTREVYTRLSDRVDSVIHIAASLNRKSSKACFNVNLRGSLEVVKLARAVQSTRGLRRFSEVSTTAVAGTRKGEVVYEDTAIDWERSDYDPYARTKKFAEHMLHELLPDVPHLVFRPSIVLGDSRFAATTQFDMVRAFVMLARLPILPFRPDWRLDIVPADYVGKAIVELHQRNDIEHGCYHLSSGQDSLRYDRIVDSLRLHGKPMLHRFVPGLNGPFEKLVSAASETPADWGVSRPAALLKVFLPYLCFDTVFDNTRVSRALGEKPKPFDQYSSGLLDFAVDHAMSYPYQAFPSAPLPSGQSVYA